MSQRPRITRRRFLRQAGIGGMTLLGWPQRFSWAVETHAATEPLKVVFYTDIHARLEWETPGAMMMAAAAINAHQPDLVLCGGDMITDGITTSAALLAPRWEAYMTMHRAITPAPVSVIGNHDMTGIAPADGRPPSENPRADFLSRMEIPRTYRSFDHGGYHFIMLDSVHLTGDELYYRGYVDEEQMNWLREDVQAIDPATPVVLITHMPLMSDFLSINLASGGEVPPKRGVVNNREVLEVFAGRTLLAVLQGHLHVSEMIQWNGTTFITGGAVSGKWWRGAWHGTAEGFGLLEFHPDRVDWSYHTYGWTARRPAGQ